MAFPPPTGRLIYNGFEFNASTRTLDFRGTPAYDSSGRTITHTVFSLTVETVLLNDPTDSITHLAVTRLTQPAAGLLVTGRGFSNVRINLGTTEDAMWGPRPRVISLKPLGNERAVKLTWTVEWAQPTCADGITRTTLANSAMMEFCWGMTFEIDKGGYTRRVFKGHVRIAQTRRDIKVRTIELTADAFREKIVPPTMEGFRRESQTYELSEDKCRLDWVVVDVELPPNALPPGVVEAEASQVWASEPGSFFKWTCTLNGTYELAKGVPVTRAVRAFFAMANDRLDVARRGMRGVKVVGGRLVPDGKPVVFVPVAASVADTQVYGRTTVAISMSVRTAGVDLSQILNVGGLWRPVAGNAGGDFGKWRTSLTAHLGPRGVAGLKVDPADDVIADLCRVTPPKPPGGRTPQPTPLGIGVLLPLQILEILRNEEILGPPGGPLSAPPPEASYLEFSAAVRTDTDSGLAAGRTLPSRPLSPADNTPVAWDALAAPLPTGKPVPAVPEGVNFTSASAGSVFAQQRAAPVTYLFLTGFALRAGFPVDQPAVLSVGGNAVSPANRLDRGEGFEQSVVGNCLVPVYAARWNLRYLITDTPADPIPVPPNRLQGA